MIYISHNGENLGEFEEGHIQLLFSEGKIDHSAYFWREGMEDWKPISEFVVNTEEKKEITGTNIIEIRKDKDQPTKTQLTFLEKRGLTVEGISKDEATRLVEDTKEREAEEKRTRLVEDNILKEKRIKEANKPNPEHLACLDYHSVKYKKDITRYEASDLVSKVRSKYQDSKWNLVKHLIRPDLFKRISSTDHLQSLKEDLKIAKSKYDLIKNDANASKEEIQEALDEYEDTKLDIESEKESAIEAVESWYDMFSSKEDYDLYDDKNLPILLKAFKKPNKTQIKAVLEEFKEKYQFPSELISLSQFFFVYKRLYPDSLNKGAKVNFSFSDISVAKTYLEDIALEKSGKAGSKKGIGCLTFLVVIPVAILFLLIFLNIIFKK